MRTFKLGDPIQIGSARGEVKSANNKEVAIQWYNEDWSYLNRQLFNAMLTPTNTTTDIIGDVQVTVHEPGLSPEVVSLARELVLTRTPQTAISDAIAFYNAVKNYKPCGTEQPK